MKGFISYSHDDIAMCGELRKHLSFLERVHGIVFWADDAIRGGDQRDPRILDAVNEADIFLMLCSTNWLDSDYIQEVEVPAIHARVAQTRGLVLPVVLVKCAWAEEFPSLKPVPNVNHRQKPIGDWKPIRDGYDQARIEIVEAIRKRFNPPKMGRDWSSGVPDQDHAAMTWVKLDKLFVAEVGGDLSDARVAQDMVVCQIHDCLRDMARMLADRLAVPATDPDIAADREPIAERVRALAQGLAIETDAVPGRIGELYSAIQTLGGSRDALRRLREVRTNAPDPLSQSEYADLDGLVTQAALWIRQFPRARDLDAGSVIPSDLPRLIPLARAIVTAAQAAHLIEDADADRILSPLAEASGATPETKSRAVLGARNLLYRLGTFALGFIPDPVLPGDAADDGVANAFAGMLVDQSDGITAFLRGAPGEVGEAFGRLIAISGKFGLRALAKRPEPEPSAPTEPEAVFSLDEVKRRILAGETIPAAWVPLVTKLNLSRTNLSDVRPLGALTALQSLDLLGTQVSDVRADRSPIPQSQLYAGERRDAARVPQGAEETGSDQNQPHRRGSPPAAGADDPGRTAKAPRAARGPLTPSPAGPPAATSRSTKHLPLAGRLR